MPLNRHFLTKAFQHNNMVEFNTDIRAMMCLSLAVVLLLYAIIIFPDDFELQPSHELDDLLMHKGAYYVTTFAGLAFVIVGIMPKVLEQFET